jgi:hypothetical protein
MPLTIRPTITLSDDDLAAILAALRPSRASGSTVAHPPSEPDDDVRLPAGWSLVERREGERYTWPQGDDVYDPFSVYEGRTSEGSIRLAIGRCDRAAVWGKDRLYLITFHITPGGKQPLCEFLEADDYAETRELVAIIRGTGESKRGMYAPEDGLPEAYASLRTGIYRKYIDADRSWDKQAVIAREDDVETMLNHSLIQAGLRFGIRPS